MDATSLLSGHIGVFLLASFFLILFATVSFKRNSRTPPLPPGPSGEPVLGHLRVIPTENPEYAYMRWSKECGSDILSFNILGQPIIVLNSVHSATDLLDKRGGNYCDRPRFVLFGEMGWRKTLSFMRWGSEFRMHRRVLQKSFQKSSIAQFRSLQEREAMLMVRGIMAKPQSWERAVRRFSTSVVLGIGFGIKVDEDSDPFIQAAADASYALAHGGAPAGTPVDFFPFLRYLPACFHDRSLKFARDWRWAIRNLHDKPFGAVMSSPERNPCLVEAMLDQRDSQIKNGETPEFSIEDIKGAAGAVFAAGQDTTWSTLLVFVLNMVLHPEIQSKAQDMVDNVVGRERTPTLEDRPRLRYIEYIMQETLRWCPVSPLGVPHRSLQDDVYGGYLIPAGSYIYANARAMTHDDRVHSFPENFDPDRYIPVDEGGRGEPFPVGHFGFGRRVCVGKHLAEASLWIAMASLLSTMNIVKERDRLGSEITPDVELTHGLTSHPRLFPCRFLPRGGRGSGKYNSHA